MKKLLRLLPLVLLLTACADPTVTSAPLPTRTVSFASDVAPVLQTSCASCHHDGSSSGGFSLADASSKTVYAYVRSGATSIVASIQSGSMPRGGGSVSTSDLALIKAWVNQGSLDN